MAISWQDSVPFFTLISVAEPAVAAAVAEHSGVNIHIFLEIWDNFRLLKIIYSKGQLISKCLFEKIVWTKIPTKNLIASANYNCGQ